MGNQTAQAKEVYWKVITIKATLSRVYSQGLILFSLKEILGYFRRLTFSNFCGCVPNKKQLLPNKVEHLAQYLLWSQLYICYHYRGWILHFHWEIKTCSWGSICATVESAHPGTEMPPFLLLHEWKRYWQSWCVTLASKTSRQLLDMARVRTAGWWVGEG